MTSRTFFLWFLLILLSSSLLAGPDEERAKLPLPSTSKDRAALEQARKAREEEQHRKALEQLKAAALGTPAPKRDAWQEGDSHAAALNGYLDDAITARTALARSCEQYKDEPDTPILRAGLSVMLFTRQKLLSRSRI